MAMKREMKRLGYIIHDYNDCELRWDGERCLPEDDAVIRTYDDHRMAMSEAIAAAAGNGAEIDRSDSVRISYPDFYQILESTTID